jgi:hypothetical protein
MNYKELLNKVQNNIIANQDESPKEELMEYKQDFLEMNIGSLTAIMNHANLY